MSHQYNFTISELEQKFKGASEQVKEYQQLPTDIMSLKPEPERWSIHEICQHLVVFGKLYLREMDAAITKAAPMPQKSGPFRPRWHFRKMAAFFEPPYKLKMKTLPVLKPVLENEIEDTLDELDDIQANVLYVLDQAAENHWDLKKIKGKNPVYRFLSMNLIELLVNMETHQRRHFWQVEQNLKLFEYQKETD